MIARLPLVPYVIIKSKVTRGFSLLASQEKPLGPEYHCLKYLRTSDYIIKPGSLVQIPSVSIWCMVKYLL